RRARARDARGVVLMWRWAFASPLALLLVAASCDPVDDQQRTDLGGEIGGLRPGPDHRPGQPCLVCHRTDFAVAGTVFDLRPSDEEAARARGRGGANVTLTDSVGSSVTKTTRATGNFYVLLGEWAPTWPIKVRVEADGIVQQMTTQVGEQGSCGACHQHPSSR